MGTLQNNKSILYLKEKKSYDKMTTICELQKLAKEAKIKYYMTLNKDQLCSALGMEPSLSNEKYEHCCRGKTNKTVKITLINKNTGEKQEFKSIYNAAKSVGKKPRFYILSTKQKK